MHIRSRARFPRVRVLLLVFMLMSMASSLTFTASAAPADSGIQGVLAPAQTAPTVDMCLALDTDGNLNLTNNEIAQFDIDLDGNGVVNDADRDIISSFCVAAPSTPINFVTICHRTQSEVNPYEVITINAAAVIAAHLSPNHQWGEDIVPKFTHNGQEYGPQGDQSLLENGCVPLEPEPDPGTFHVQKFYCDSVEEATVIEGEFDTSGCESGTATFVILDSNDASVPFDQEDLLDGTLTLPVGNYTLLEYDKDNELVLSVPFTIVADANTVIRIANPLDPGPELGTVIVTKYFCVDDSESPFVADDYDVSECIEGTANFDILDGEGLSVLEEGDDIFAGVVLPVGTYWLVEYGENDEVLLEHEFTVLLDEILPIVVVNPVGEEPEVGTVIVEKYYCEDEDIEAPVVSDPEAFDDCVAGDAVFDLLDDTLANGGASVLVEGDDLFAGVELPLGTYYLVEWFDGAWVEMATVELDEDGETLTYTVVNPVEPEEITINIYKEVCSEISDAEDDGCIGSDDLDGTEIDFTVTYAIGEEETTVETSLVVEGSSGSAVVDLPLADSYTVCEMVPDGVETVLFGIDVDNAVATDDGCISFSGEDVPESGVVNVLFWNDLEDEEPGTPEKPEKPIPPTVTKLPDTGSGSADASAVAPWTLIAGAVALAGAGAFLRKKRLAA